MTSMLSKIVRRWRALAFLVPFMGLAMAGSSASVAGPRSVAIVAGYPSPDAPLYEFAFRQRHAKVDVFEAAWLPVTDYAKYAVVVLTGNLTRAQAKPSTYGDDDLNPLRQFIQSGGTLLLTSGSFDVFRSPAGRTFLEDVLGKPDGSKDKALKLLLPQHPWVSHFAGEKDVAWLTDVGAPIAVGKGERVIGTESGRASLWRLPIGRGQVIYVGWEFSRFLPSGRNLKSTVDDETRYEAQYKVLSNIASELCPQGNPRQSE